MDYIEKVLGIRAEYTDVAAESFPNYIHARYDIEKVYLDGVEALFVRPRRELGPINEVRKHMERIRMSQGVPAVLDLDHLAYRYKEYLLRDHIPFIVDGRQIYLPFMAIYLQERCDGEKQGLEAMLPSAQLLLLHFIYNGCKEMLTSEAVRSLGLTATSISRASRQLEEMDLIQSEKKGVQKVVYTDRTPPELFSLARGYMSNPVKRKIYVPKGEVTEPLLESGYSALSEYSMLGSPPMECFATDCISVWKNDSDKRPCDSESQCEIGLWRYDPRKLAHGRCVDPLSLSGDEDDRVAGCVDEMLESVWEDIDGTRNR
ncbi:MAG: hypothetical protein IJ799_08505 [Bacteroidales bacterium]|nr:hypothetical protein [Bacteroidales bacterium]